MGIEIDWFSIYLKCSYFQTPSSCDSGIVNITSMFDGSFLISCCMYCCTANVLSISSNGSSGQLHQSCVNDTIPLVEMTFGSSEAICLKGTSTHTRIRMQLYVQEWIKLCTHNINFSNPHPENDCILQATNWLNKNWLAHNLISASSSLSINIKHDKWKNKPQTAKMHIQRERDIIRIQFVCQKSGVTKTWAMQHRNFAIKSFLCDAIDSIFW